MITNCPVCGKAFDVLWPQLYRYRRDGKYLCSYQCMVQYDRKEGKEMTKISPEQKRKAIEIALEGGDPKPFLKECGSKSPENLWYWMKNKLKIEEPETYEMLAKGVRKKKPEIPEPVSGGPWEKMETPEKIVPIEKIDEIVPPKPLVYDGYTVRCIEGVMGKFYYDNGYDRLDWTTPEGEEVSFSPSAWKVFATEELPKVMAILGVEL